MSVPAALKFTYADYCLLPEGERYEVVDGELLLTPAPSTFHQTVSERLGFLLGSHVRESGLGLVYHAPTDVVLSPNDVVQPDLLVVLSDRKKIVVEQNVHGAPDLVVEILSPSTEDRDRVAKAKRYAAFGVREMWLVDTEKKTIEVLVNTSEGFRLEALYRETDTARSVILTRLEFPVGPVFRPI